MPTDDFLIQVGHIKINTQKAGRFERIADSFFKVFRAEEESTYLFWHRIPIRLRYFHDLYHSFDDILAMAWLLTSRDQGANRVTLHTQWVALQWQVAWQRGWVTIHSDFAAVEPLYQPYVDALRQHPRIDMAIPQFLCEWKTLLCQIAASIDETGVELHEGSEQRKRELLARVCEEIRGYGVLYGK